jgi:hypothetical protein
MAAAAALLLLAAAATASCKRKPPAGAAAPVAKATPGAPADPAATPVTCPSPERLAAALRERGRALRTGCVTFTAGRYWMATALSYDEPGGTNPRLLLVSGGSWFKPVAYDVVPLPATALQALIQKSDDVQARIRPARAESRLIRLGVLGGRGPAARRESEEVMILLRMAAHAPPQLAWVGPGDEVMVSKDGCVSERLIDFEQVFRRIERVATTRARALPGTTPADCTGGPGTQEEVAVQTAPIKHRPMSGLEALQGG